MHSLVHPRRVLPALLAALMVVPNGALAQGGNEIAVSPPVVTLPVPPGMPLTLPPNAVVLNGAVYLPVEGQPGQLVPVQPQLARPGGPVVWVPVSQGAVPPGAVPAAPPAPSAAPAPTPYTGESPALRDAKYRLRNVENEIRKTESALFFLSPPIRTTDGRGNTTFDVNRQRTYEQEKIRLERRLRQLREEKAMWEVRINTLMAG